MFYVYTLNDPNSNDVFYVGKGCKYRSKVHFKESLWKNPGKTSNPYLYAKIKVLMENGTPPVVRYVEEEITEERAYELEMSLIKQYGRKYSDEAGILLNIFVGRGPDSGYNVEWTNDRKMRHRELCRSRRGYDPTYDELFEEYIIDKLTREEIAVRHDVSVSLVKNRLKSLGIHKPKGVQYPPKNIFVCETCSKHFETPKSTIRRYCSRKCFPNLGRKKR